MSSSATVTAKSGPGITTTAIVLTNVTGINFDWLQQTVQVFCDQGQPIFDISASTTFTLTVSSGSYTLTIT